MLTIIAPAGDTSLLTLEERRAAAGVVDGSRDAELEALGKSNDASIARYCRIAAAGDAPPTLRLETLSQQFRIVRPRSALVLARRPVVEIISVTEGDTDLSDDEFEVDGSSAILRRLCGDRLATWCGKVTIQFKAGYSVVPDDLRLAAAKLLKTFHVEGSREPGLKRTETEGVGSREYWIPPSSDPAIPAEVADLLRPYMNHVLG